MKKYLVMVEITISGRKTETRAITVEAGNKKLAAIRALRQLSEGGYQDAYKNVKSVREVA